MTLTYFHCNLKSISVEVELKHKHKHKHNKYKTSYKYVILLSANLASSITLNSEEFDLPPSNKFNYLVLYILKIYLFII